MPLLYPHACRMLTGMVCAHVHHANHSAEPHDHAPVRSAAAPGPAKGACSSTRQPRAQRFRP
eukprot:124304-Chlamydomonas_euryale.AAC.1